LADVAAVNAAREPTSAVRRFMPVSCEGREHTTGARRANKNGANKNAGGFPPAFPLAVAHGLLIVVEPALARLVIALPSRTVGRTALVTPRRPGDFGTAAVKTTGRRRSTGEISAPIAHRAAIARTAARAGGRAAITAAAATTAVATAAAAIATTAAAAAIATATAAAVAATAATITTTAAAAIGRTRATRTEAAAVAATTTTEATAAATTGLTLDGFTNRDRSTIEQRAVHGLHGSGALIICFHLEEGEAAAAAGLAIHDHFRRTDGAELREGFLQTLRRDRIGQIAHKQFATHSRLGAGGRRERSPARACWTTGSKRFIDI
jgi:hypothetical protein